MTNPEVEGLVEDLLDFARRIAANAKSLATEHDQPPSSQKWWIICRDDAERTIADALSRLTHPLPDGEAGEREKVIAWNGGNVELLITGKWRVCDSASELARLIRGGARIEALRSLTTSEPRT